MNIVLIFVFLILAVVFFYMTYKGIAKVRATRDAQAEMDLDDRKTFDYLPGLLMVAAGAVLGACSLVLLFTTVTNSF